MSGHRIGASVSLAARAAIGGREAPSAELIERLLIGAGAGSAQAGADGVVARFGTRRAALVAAVLIHERFRQPDGRVAVAIDVGDPDGRRTVALAGAAKGGQTLLTAVAVDGLEPPARRAFRPLHATAERHEPHYELAPARDTIPNNLPSVLSSFVGRHADVARVRELLAEAPMLTLTGPPGTGKTRMAIELADDVLGRFPDGAWFVPMSPLSDAALVVHRIAEALGVPEAPDRRLEELVAARVRGRRLLLVIDNVEQLLDAAELLGSLASVSVGVRLLVTSRVPLRIGPETEYRLPPLAVPQEGAADLRALSRVASVRLFLDRARLARSEALLTARNAAAIAEICRRLDGLPLAIELAAARLRILNPEGLLNRLDDRLALLRSDERDRPDRHRTLAEAVARSYDLLDTAQQTLFRRLGAFRGTFSIEAAAAVGLDTDVDRARALDLIAALADQGLIQAANEDGDGPRFRLLETLREYAAERLTAAGEEGGIRERHARYFAALAARRTPLGSVEDAAKQAILRRDQENLRAAFEWSIAVDQPEMAAALALGATTMLFGSGQLTEGRRWLDAVAGLGDRLPPIMHAHTVATQGRFAFWQGDLPAAEAAYVRAVAAWRELDDDTEVARALVDSAWPRILSEGRSSDDLASSAAAAEDGLAVARRSGTKVEEARALWTLGAIAFLRGATTDAERLTEQSASLLRSVDERYWLALVLITLGIFRQASGNLFGSRGAAHEALTVLGNLHPWVAPVIVDHLAALALEEGNALRAARLAAAAASHTSAMGANLAFIVNRLAGRRGSRGPAEDPLIARAWAEGLSMSLDEAVEFALHDASIARTSRTLASKTALRVRSFGTFQAEVRGQPIRHWGGAKAGARHAQAMFGFLFDRGGRGVSKDEFQEVIWPDSDLEKADVALHRTLGGLRRTLAAATGIPYGETIVFANDRYRLGPEVVDWSDVAAFEDAVTSAHEALDPGETIPLLEDARELVRGDYLDDCPFYGDSSYVEERRGELRDRLGDVLLELAERYEAEGAIEIARARFRAALASSEQAGTRAREGLARLGIVGA